MASGKDQSSLFSSIFALFIYDLFNEVATWSNDSKKQWSDYVISFQDEKTGFFIDESVGIYPNSFNKKPLYQSLGASGYSLHTINFWTRDSTFGDTFDKYYWGNPLLGHNRTFLKYLK